MKGFIEIERKDRKIKELLGVAHIASVQASDIMLNVLCDNGYTKDCYIVPTTHTYEEIVDKIDKAVKGE